MRTDTAAVSLIQPGRYSWSQLLRDLARNVGVVHVTAYRTINSRYRQTLLGAGWTIIQPLAVLLVFTVFIGGLAGVETSDGSYQSFALSAVVPWQFFSAIVFEGASSLMNEVAVVRRLAVSRLALIVGRAGAAVVPYSVGLALMGVLAPLLGAKLTTNLLWLPLLSVLVASPALALAVSLAAIGVWIRDVHVGLPFAMQALLFASPVAYPASGLEPGRLRLFAALNPIVGPLEGFRRVYVLGQSPRLDLLLLSALTTLVLLLVSLEVFRRLEPGFADVV